MITREGRLYAPSKPTGLGGRQRTPIGCALFDGVPNDWDGRSPNTGFSESADI